MLIPSRSRTLKSIATAFAVLLSSTVLAQTTLKVSAIPDENPTELLRKFAPLGKYLESKIGMKVEFTPVTDYAATVEGLAAKKIDLVWYGGFTFVQARLKTGTAIPIAQREEDEKFRSVFITQPNSGINSLKDLNGKTFTFGAPSSTSGSLMPRYFMMKEGIDPDKALKRVAFSGAHDATALQVAGGKVDAGALNISVFEKMLAEKKLDASQVKVFYTTPGYYDYNWTVRGDLDPALISKLTDAFLSLDAKNPEHKAILDLQRATRFIATKPENYKSIEEAARSAGLLK
jgi:phosphonate transport system substrate-binding protein